MKGDHPSIQLPIPLITVVSPVDKLDFSEGLESQKAFSCQQQHKLELTNNSGLKSLSPFLISHSSSFPVSANL